MVSSVSDLWICFLPGHTISQAGQDLWCQHSDLSRSTSACKCMKNPNLSTMNLTIELLPKIAKAQFTKSTARTESWIHIKELLCSVQTLLGVSTRSKHFTGSLVTLSPFVKMLKYCILQITTYTSQQLASLLLRLGLKAIPFLQYFLQKLNIQKVSTGLGSTS